MPSFVPDLTVILAFAVASAVLAITPGPDMALQLSRTVNDGRAHGSVTMFGAMSGIAVHTTLVALGKPGEAIALLEKALASGHEFDRVEHANAQFALAKAHVAAGHDRTAALALAQQARATFLLSPQASHAALTELNSWVKKQAR